MILSRWFRLSYSEKHFSPQSRSAHHIHSRTVSEVLPATLSNLDRYCVFYLRLTAAVTQFISYQWAATDTPPVTVICRWIFGRQAGGVETRAAVDRLTSKSTPRYERNSPRNGLKRVETGKVTLVWIAGTQTHDSSSSTGEFNGWSCKQTFPGVTKPTQSANAVDS